MPSDNLRFHPLHPGEIQATYDPGKIINDILMDLRLFYHGLLQNPPVRKHVKKPGVDIGWCR
jgi:hypothetical protein